MTLRRRAFLASPALAAVAAPATSAAAPGAVAPGHARLGLALGSGALHGWAHVGVVRAWERAGLRPDVIVGSSAGAAVGALWAAGLDADRIGALAARIDWTPGSAWTWLLRRPPRHDALRQLIDEAVGQRPIEQLGLPFAAAATDARSGESVLIDAGPTGLAIEASCAIPLRQAPVPLGGRALIDGSLTMPVPVAASRQLGADVVVAVDVAYRPYEETPGNWMDEAFQSMHILTNALAREQTRGADHRIKLDLHGLMRPRFQPQRLIDAGDAAMTALIPTLARPPDTRRSR